MRLLVAGLALALTTSMGMAGSMDMTEMNNGLTMLENSAKTALATYEIKADVMTLTLSQLGEISTIIAEGGSNQNTKAQLEAALARK